MKKLAKHQKQRDFISVSRSAIDSNPVSGFILGASAELVVIQHVYDFRLDGLMALRVADITEATCSATAEFQKHLLEQEGLLAQVPFDAVFDLRNFKNLIDQLSRQYEFLIVEGETLDEESDFFIGRILKTTRTSLHGQYFSGTGEWSDEAEIIKYKDISSCQAGSNYINVYQRHFARTSRKASVESSGVAPMSSHRIFTTAFAKVYPMYVQKAQRKNRSQAEVDQIICWLTGYELSDLQKQIELAVDFQTFFAQAPAMHPNRTLITGVVCGVRVEEVADPLMQQIRYLDKLIDELAKGKAMEKILRQ